MRLVAGGRSPRVRLAKRQLAFVVCNQTDPQPGKRMLKQVFIQQRECEGHKEGVRDAGEGLGIRRAWREERDRDKDRKRGEEKEEERERCCTYASMHPHTGGISQVVLTQNHCVRGHRRKRRMSRRDAPGRRQRVERTLKQAATTTRLGEEKRYSSMLHAHAPCYVKCMCGVCVCVCVCVCVRECAIVFEPV